MEPEAGTAPRRRCRIKLDDLAENMDMASVELKAYLDVEAGEVLYIHQEVWRDLETVWEDLPESLSSATPDERRAALVEAIAEQEYLNTDEEQILEADAIEDGLGTRYEQLPEQDSREGYQDMEAFIETVEDRRLYSRLDRAIRGRGAFRRFKDELRDAPESEEQRWFAFKLDRQRERARRWLDANDIDLIEA
jgi:hypothetical protein